VRVFHGVRPSQPPRPPSDARDNREVQLEAFAGETTGWVLSSETGLIPRCRSRSAEAKATSSPRKWLADEEPRAVGDPMHVETSFVGTWETSSVPGQHAGPAHEGNSRTMGMHADEESDDA
jgi:hypothetical protein